MTHFQQQSIIFDTTFCGDASALQFSGQCKAEIEATSLPLGPPPSGDKLQAWQKGKCANYIAQNPDKLSEAYWLVNQVSVFGIAGIQCGEGVQGCNALCPTEDGLEVLNDCIANCEERCPLPTHSICQTLCPSCKTNPDPTSDPPGHQPRSCTKCASVDQKCWPGQSMTNSSDHTCDCFGKLGFCKKGELPKRVEGQSCPSCWPMDNTACACFAALSYCDAP
jgi:hypothetical protein